ncbi:ABC transporter permease [Microbacterium karelineae]|uniref:ABC transporter permease n=1 Tax=Microbacterium karelineae TaxID=2654283 RepID=UPI0012EA3233|nr:ABC transporter permease [Microbacterium karelineae]
MNPTRIGVLVGLDLRQRARRPGFYVLLGVFFVVVSGITWLGSLVFSGSASVASGMISVAIYGVLLMAVLVTPTFTGNAINGDRDSATLAPVQVTLATTAEILVAKLLAGWATGLVYLVVAIPALMFALIRGEIEPPQGWMGASAAEPAHPATLLVAVLVLAIEIGVIAAIGVGLSAIIARPLFSVAATYLVVMLLVLGTVIAFGLGTFAVRSSTATLTESPEMLYVPGQGTSPLPACDEGDEPCIEPRPDISAQCVEVRGAGEAPRYDRVWWILAANPFVVLADATPTAYDTSGNPVDLFGQLKYGVRGAQHPPELVSDDWTDPCDGEPYVEGEFHGGEALQSDYETPRETIERSLPSWFVGLGIQVLLAAGLMLWGASRMHTPARRTPPGSRIA